MVPIYSIIIFLIIILLISKCIVIIRNLYLKIWRLSKIPGPKRHWLFGNTSDLFSARGNMYNSIRTWEKNYGSIYSIITPLMGIVAISSPEDIKKVLVGKNHMEKGFLYDFLKKWLRNNLITHSVDRYHEKRKLVVPSFNKSVNFEIFLRIFEKESERVVEELTILNNNSNIIPIIAEFTFKTVAESAFGVKIDLEIEENKRYHKNMEKLLVMTMNRITNPWLYLDFFYYKLTRTGREEEKCIKDVHKFSEKIFNDIVQQEDFSVNDSKLSNLLIGNLINGSHKNSIKFDEIPEHFDGIIAASVDLVSLTTAFLLLELSANQKYQDKVINEIHHTLKENENCSLAQINELHFLDMCVKETLRKYPPLSIIVRKSGEDILTSQGYMIPKNVDIAISILSLHRNPQIYPKPDEFDPYRFLPENVKSRGQYTYLPFSAGFRSCLGSRFAFLQIKILIVKILQNYTVYSADTPSTIEFALDLSLQPKNGVHLKFVKRY